VELVRADAWSATADQSVIEFRNVTKTYKSLLGRTVKAVEEFSLQVAEGEILGIAGPNGAGKSTILSMLLGYFPPTSGDILVDAMSPRRFVERNGIGYLSELIAIPPRWKLEVALERYAVLADIAPAELRTRVDQVIAQLGLDEHRGKRVKSLSKGTLQRVGLAQALLRDERLMILDEPTHGLDPVWTQNFRDIVTALKKPSRTIIIASHNLDELQRIADRVAIIDHGKLQRLVTTGFSEDDKSSGNYHFGVAGGSELVAGIEPRAIAAGTNEFQVGPITIVELNDLIRRLMQGGVLIASVVPAESVLERQFREAVADQPSGTTT
jgi:ABC-type multidrug transport system ATPase subunit